MDPLIPFLRSHPEKIKDYLRMPGASMKFLIDNGIVNLEAVQPEVKHNYYHYNIAKNRANVARYRSNDPTGKKARGRYISQLRYLYNKRRSVKLAVRLYLLKHNVTDPSEVTASLGDIIREAGI